MDGKNREAELPEDPTGKPVKRRRGRPTISDARLLDAALEIFLDQGFERTSIEAISAASGMAKRTIYTRYGTKTNLFIAALKSAIEKRAVPHSFLLSAKGKTMDETLLRIARLLVSNMLEPTSTQIMRLCIAEAQRLPEIGEIYYRQANETAFTFLREYFEQELGLPEKGMPNSALAANSFLHLVVGGPANSAALGRNIERSGVDFFIQGTVNILLKGLEPRPAERLERLLPAEQDASATQMVDHRGGEDDEEIRKLRTENRRLRNLLLNSMLALEGFKDQINLPEDD